MDRDTSQLPKALVLRWNSQKLRVRCPFCLYSHSHSYSGPLGDETFDPTKPGWKLRSHRTSRRSDCTDVDEGGVYTFIFPHTNDPVTQGYGWEVDDESFGFVAVNEGGVVEVPINEWLYGRTLLPQYQCQPKDSADVDDAEAEMSWLAALAGATSGLDLDRQDSTGEESPVPSRSPQQTAREILDETFRRGERTPFATPPPQKTDDEIWAELFAEPDFRKYCYISYCVRRNIPALEQLCRQYLHDALIGYVDEDGESGALCAAIEERGLETLRWLHDRGDSITRANHYGRTPLMEAALWGRLETVRYLVEKRVDPEARDGNGMRAVDLAANTVRNVEERTGRLRRSIYREAANADRQRRQIEEVLERLALPTSSHTETPHSSRSQGSAFFNRKSDGTLEVYRPQILLEPPSGRDGRPQMQKAFATLDRGPNYAPINAMSGYTHPDWPNVLDNNVWTDKAQLLRGFLGLPEDRSAASHVEPQLLAYLIDHHSLRLLPRSTETQELLEAMPTYSLRPVITVSKTAFCQSCREMIELFKEQFPELGVTLHCVGDSARAPLDSM
jgi:hypothetical protein